MLQGLLLKKLLVGQLAVQGFSMATIEFFKRAYDLLSLEKGVGCPKMSQAAFLSRQNANKHVRVLEEAGYLKRCSYRSWRISDNAITDPDFLGLIRRTENTILDPDLMFLVMSAGMAA